MIEVGEWFCVLYVLFLQILVCKADMDKSTFDNSYEFLSATNEPGGEFFLVQEDGTFFINKSEGQVVSQENSDQCTIYDASNTQLLVDNTSCLVTVRDGYTIPDAPTSANDIMYGNKDPILQLEPDIVMNDPSVEEAELQTTEITLSNEQYSLLEQNGWSLLEIGDRIFMLDSSGLQDITTNIDLIQQLKAEIQTPQELEPTRSILKNDFKNHPTEAQQRLENFQTNEDTIELVFENDSVAVETTATESIAANGVVDINRKSVLHDPNEIKTADTSSSRLSQSQNITESQNANVLTNVGPAKPTLSNPLRLRTEYCLKDIPEKILLGKTVNGKNLVARVTTIISCPKNKPNHPKGFIKKDILKSSIKKGTAKPRAKVEPKLLSKQVAWRNASHLRNLPIGRGRSTEDDGGEKLFMEVLEGAIGGPLTGKQMAAAEKVAVQLMQMPALLPMIENANLIITKTVKNAETASCLETCVLIGCVTTTNGEYPQFVHIPTLIQDIIDNKEPMNPGRTGKPPDKSCSLLHIHITETKYKDQEDAISITLNKRLLQKEEQSKVFECGICTAIYRTADELADHQENHDMDSEDLLTIDTEDVASENEDDRMLIMLHRK